MDPILENGEHFSGEEDTSEEQRRAKQNFPFLGRVFYKENMEMEEEKVVSPAPPASGAGGEEDESSLQDDDDFFAELEDGIEKAAPDPREEDLKTHNEHNDPQTCYVQHVIATTIFGNNLPQEPPKWGVDTEELFLDKTFYHKAAKGSERFKKENYEPLVQRVTDRVQALVSASPVMTEIHCMIADCPEMECNVVKDKDKGKHVSAWTNKPLTGEYYQIVLSKNKDKTETRTIYMEPEFTIRLSSIHVVYHLWGYVNGSFMQHYTLKEVSNFNFMDLWTYLVSEDFTDEPISEWCEPFFDVFAEKIFKIFQTYNAIDEWSKG